MLAEAIILSFIISLCFKGRFENFSDLPIQLLFIPMLAFGLEFLGARLITYQVPFYLNYPNQITWGIEVLANLLLVVFFYRNRSIAGMKLMCLGVLLNFIAILSNAGYMPVDPKLGIEYGFETSLMALKNNQVFAHKLMTQSTHLNVLGDWITIPPPWPFPKTISAGDILIDLGAFFLIFKGMTSGHTRLNSV